MISLFAAAVLVFAAPAPSSSVQKAVDLDGDGATDRVRLDARATGLWLVVEPSRGGKAERLLGDSELPFQLDGHTSRMTVRDVTGDGRAEILVAAASDSKGLLYVLALQKDELVSLASHADAFVSETGSFPDALAIDSKGRVTIASLEHSEEAGPKEALFTFEWNEKTRGYRLAATDRATDD